MIPGFSNQAPMDSLAHFVERIEHKIIPVLQTSGWTISRLFMTPADVTFCDSRKYGNLYLGPGNSYPV